MYAFEEAKLAFEIRNNLLKDSGKLVFGKKSGVLSFIELDNNLRIEIINNRKGSEYKNLFGVTFKEGRKTKVAAIVVNKTSFKNKKEYNEWLKTNISNIIIRNSGTLIHELAHTFDMDRVGKYFSLASNNLSKLYTQHKNLLIKLVRLQKTSAKKRTMNKITKLCEEINWHQFNEPLELNAFFIEGLWFLDHNLFSYQNKQEFLTKHRDVYSFIAKFWNKHCQHFKQMVSEENKRRIEKRLVIFYNKLSEDFYN